MVNIVHSTYLFTELREEHKRRKRRAVNGRAALAVSPSRGVCLVDRLRRLDAYRMAALRPSTLYPRLTFAVCTKAVLTPIR